MKRKLLSILLALFMVMSLTTCFAAAAGIPQSFSNAVYLGVEGYGTITANDKDNFMHMFSINGNSVAYKVSTANNYALNNVLAEGYVFDIIIEGDTVVGVSVPTPSAAGNIDAATTGAITVAGKTIRLTGDTKIYEITTQAGGATVTASSLSAGDSVKVYGTPPNAVYKTFVAKPYQAPVKGTPGKRTLKNFLATTLEPVGTALYVYGGAWDWQDQASSNQSTTIGLAQSWLDFFQAQDDTYTYKNIDDIAHSYYPHKSYNQYYYPGIDCSAYVAWSVYNVMNTTSGKQGYVKSSTAMARSLADQYDYGTWEHSNDPQKIKPGDIFSVSGHAWIALGTCSDGSIVILHSTPSNSDSGYPGGGVQLSGVGENENCQAYQLAKTYMQRYYPAWDERYTAVFKKTSDYVKITTSSGADSPNAGRFSWHLNEKGLSDPDGYANMSAEQILKDLFQ